ncbi:MAG: N-formylglutamate amidohydrolase [Planctomycetes bacterium]|nr:N-formylglutamate amidohydrolase [Planctomycetota bacterium]
MTGRLQVVVSCEHASAAIPPELGDLGLPLAVRRSHRAFDRGALGVARRLARALRVPLHAGEWSRLVVDLNRSADARGVVPRSVDGCPIPGNDLTDAQRKRRVLDYWRPFRAAVQRAIVRAARSGPVLHLSVHSFTPELRGVVRANDLGLLCDPARPREVELVEALRGGLAASGLSVRRNFPYFGDTDGFTSFVRQHLPAKRYCGLEIECNQRVVGTPAGERRVASALLAALRIVR